MPNDTNFEKISAHWIESSEEDFETMLSLFETKHYHWALFVGHLCLEKLLKALYIVKFQKKFLFIHDLLRLAELNNLELTFEKEEWLDEITLFNINTRYSDYKKDFHSRCTPKYTKIWIERIKELRLWIRTMF